MPRLRSEHRAQRRSGLRTRLRRSAICTALAASVALHAPAARATVLFVLDGKNGRILWFDQKGMHTLAPHVGRTNLLTSPKAIATDSRNELVVLNGDYPQLVNIDVQTGEQFEDGGSAAFAFGLLPDGLAIDPRTPPLLSFPSLYVGAVGEIDVVSRTLLASTASPLGSFPMGYEQAGTQFVATHDPGTGPLDVFASTELGLLGWDGSQVSEVWVPPQGSITGLDEYDFQTNHRLFVSYQYATCPSDSNGLYYFDVSGGVQQHTGFADLHPYSVTGDVPCPGAIALTKNLADGIPPDPIYIVDRGSSPQRILFLYGAATNTGVAATMPSDSDAVGLVVYSPEPGMGGLGAAALAATLACAARRRAAA